MYRERYILSFRQTLRGSPDDRNGIDFYFSIKVKGKRIEIPLQVKSSQTGIKAHDKHYSMIHAVNGQAPDLREQIEFIIIDYHNDLGGEDTMIPEVVSKPVEVEPVEEERKLELVPAVQNAVNPEDIILEIQDGQVWTTSLEVARIFGKRHDAVLRDIRDLKVSLKFRAHNFVEGFYSDANGQSRPMFKMNKKAFARLTMGFTGDRAAEFQEQYVERFEEMEEQLRNPQPLALSGDFGALLIQAGQQIQEQNLVITTLKQQTELLAEDVVKQV